VRTTDGYDGGFLTRRCVPVCEWGSVSHTARSQEGAQRREAAPRRPAPPAGSGAPVREAHYDHGLPLEAARSRPSAALATRQSGKDR